MIAAPASRGRRTAALSVLAGPMSMPVPHIDETPATSVSSLTAIGTPRQRQFLPGGQPPLHLRRFGRRLVGQDHPKGVQHRVQSGDPVQIERHQFVGRHLTLP